MEKFVCTKNYFKSLFKIVKKNEGKPIYLIGGN